MHLLTGKKYETFFISAILDTAYTVTHIHILFDEMVIIHTYYITTLVSIITLDDNWYFVRLRTRKVTNMIDTS